MHINKTKKLMGFLILELSFNKKTLTLIIFTESQKSTLILMRKIKYLRYKHNSSPHLLFTCISLQYVHQPHIFTTNMILNTTNLSCLHIQANTIAYLTTLTYYFFPKCSSN